MSRETTDVAIIGGGVIGLSIAYLLSGEGRHVSVLDAGPMGREASWAGAGIISPGAERPTPLPASKLRTLSARLHAEWAEQLLEETGIDNGYRRSGGVDVALNDQDVADLASAAGRWRDEGIAFEKLVPGDFARVEPALGPQVRSAYFLPDRAQIRNPWHLRALTAAIIKRGGVMHSTRSVTGFDVSESRIVGLQTASGPLTCGAAVVAAGAWSESLLRPLGRTILTAPIRGQILLLNPDRPRIHRIVEWGSCYLVPRDDGRILVGSTEESVGFCRQTTSAAISDLKALAGRLCPVLVDAPIENAWAGLRPGSIDTRPYLGPLPNYDNLWIATGHNRAGLQLSPGSAAMIAAMVTGREPPIKATAFRVDRQPKESHLP